MAAAATRASAWTTSIAVHAAIVTVLMIALGHGHRHEAEEKLARLVYVEPVAPPLAVREAAAPPAPVAEAPPVERPKPTKPEAAPVARRPAPVISKPLRAARGPTEPSAPPAVEAPAPPADAVVLAPADGTTVGSASGLAGGTVGGLGSAPLALKDVAAPPELVSRVLPEYPARARAMQIEGQVMLEVVLDRDGRIEDGIRVVRSIAALDAAAIDAVKQWRFRPARDRSGRPVRVRMEVPVRFVLR